MGSSRRGVRRLGRFTGLQPDAGLVGGFGAIASRILDVALGVQVHWLVCALFAWLLIAVLGTLRVDPTVECRNSARHRDRGGGALQRRTVPAPAVGGAIDASPLSPRHYLEPGGIAAIVGATASFVGVEAAVVFAEEKSDHGAPSPSQPTWPS